MGSPKEAIWLSRGASRWKEASAWGAVGVEHAGHGMAVGAAGGVGGGDEDPGPGTEKAALPRVWPGTAIVTVPPKPGSSPSCGSRDPYRRGRVGGSPAHHQLVRAAVPGRSGPGAARVPGRARNDASWWWGEHFDVARAAISTALSAWSGWKWVSTRRRRPDGWWPVARNRGSD